MTLQDPMRRTARLIEESAGDDVVIYDRDSDNVTALGAVEVQLWRACDGTRSITDLAMLTELSETEAAAALARLDGAGLMAETGMSRRGLLQKAGIVGAGITAVSLASIVAPVAAHAATLNTGPTKVVSGVSLQSPILTLVGGSVTVGTKGVAVVPPVIGTGYDPATDVTVNYSFTGPGGKTTTKTINVLSSDDGSIYIGKTLVPNVDPGAVFNGTTQLAGKTVAKPLTAVVTLVNKL